jgi:tellurite resistance protein
VTPQEGLVYTMVMVAAADRDLNAKETARLEALVGHLPAFRSFDRRKLPQTAEACAKLLSGPNGLERTLAAIKKALPDRLATTAFALACDMIAADGSVHLEEMTLLNMLADTLNIDRLEQAAIQFAAGARYRKA